MPWIIGPPCNEFCFKVKREQRDHGGAMYIIDDPDDPASGCKISFDENGRFFLPDSGKFQGERVKDLLKWITELPGWGETILPDSTDGWWGKHGSEWGVHFEEGKTKMTMKVTKADQSVAEAAAHIVRPYQGDEVEITTGQEVST